MKLNEVTLETPKIELNDTELFHEVARALDGYRQVFIKSTQLSTCEKYLATILNNHESVKYLMTLVNDEYEEKGKKIIHILANSDEWFEAYESDDERQNMLILIGILLKSGTATNVNNDIIELIEEHCEAYKDLLVDLIIQNDNNLLSLPAVLYVIKNIDTLTAKERHQLIKRGKEFDRLSTRILVAACYDPIKSRTIYLTMMFFIGCIIIGLTAVVSSPAAIGAIIFGWVLTTYILERKIIGK